MALYGWALFEGVGIGMDEERGERLLQQSKHEIARGYCALFGIGVDGDDEQAYRLLRTHCDTSDPHVQYMLGRCYHLGRGCQEDEAQAMQCYERAGNHVGALYSVALM
eukprot:TRINITY_DN5709_c0_g1_i3.p2 TRINITY_DN5709_c0_g1~~TRINITY_DN5709_c0_g1_i3.p2  ORF type:complete len:121 (+),score=26.58 TRINITY_DN5709_c0_g1_i3:40-363(+)